MRNKKQTLLGLREDLSTVSLGLTFAGLHAFRPPVINLVAAKRSAVLEPSTARSATTDSAGFLERAAFGARGTP